jgi:tetratricopeptide (TPR) repeat protein
MTHVCFGMRRVALTVLVSLWPALLWAQPTPGSRVLIMPFATEVETNAPGGAGAALWLGEAAALLLGEDLTALGVGALAREERVLAFDRLNIPMSAALTRATMIRVGELIGASEVIFGEVKLGTRLQVRARLVRLAAGREMPDTTEEASLEDIFALFSRLASRVAAHTGRLRPTALPLATPLPLETFESYVKGLVATTPAAQQRFLESAIRQAPGDPRILLALWQVYSSQGVHERALATANAVPLESPLSRKARFAVALSLIELKRFDGAYQLLSSLHSGGRSAALSNALGTVQLRRGVAPAGMSPATAYFRRAVDEDPENTDYLFNLGYAHAMASNAAEALTWLREAVRFDAADGDAHLVMSAVLASSGRPAEALREHDLARLLGAVDESAGRTPPTRVPAALERLTTVLDVTPGPRLATVVANPAQRDQRETAAFHLANGRTHFAARRDREAMQELRRAVYLAPYEDEPHLLLGELYRRGGQLPEAIDEFKVAIWCRETAAARLSLATTLFEAGDRTEARREAERALVLAPASTEARDLLERIGR